MGFIRRFWCLIAVFGLLFAATFLIQATKNNIVSNFFIEWASVWSTFIGTIAAVLVVIMAVVAYWQERKIRLSVVQGKIDEWVINLYKIPGVLEMWHEGQGLITEQERKNIMDIIDKSLKDAPEIIRLADKNAPEIRETIQDVGIAVANMRLELLKSPVNRDRFIEIFHSMSDAVEETLRYEII